MANTPFMTAISRIVTFTLNWVGVVIYAWLVFELIRIWLSPKPDDVSRILTLAVIMGFEFIMVHSGVFMAVMPRRISLLVFVPFYGVFALAMNMIAPGNDVLWIYLGIVVVRMRFAFSNPTQLAKAQNMAVSVFAAMTYFILIFVFAFGANMIPEAGITADYLAQNNYSALHDSGGIFIDTPHIPITMGIVYFSLLAAFEVFVFRLWKPSRSRLPNSRS